MSETILRVLASELLTLRVCCGACKTVIELPAEAEAVERVFHGEFSCPICRTHFRKSSSLPSPLRTLAAAIEELRRDTSSATVEFVVAPPK